MADLEDICEDQKCWANFEGEEGETIGVYARCPECGKYLKRGRLLLNLAGDVKLEDWKCSKHGEIEPYFLRY
jgi:PHP family Zn ribbon phosphoesterase